MEIQTFKIFSYCSDLTEKQQEYFEEYPCDIYITYTVVEEDDELGINSTLTSLGAEVGEEVLIHIDY